jgi:hypothetical protein
MPQAHNALVTQHLADLYEDLALDGSEIRWLPSMKDGGLAQCTVPSGKMSNAVSHRLSFGLLNILAWMLVGFS